jgi:hypothetical protein
VKQLNRLLFISTIVLVSFAFGKSGKDHYIKADCHSCHGVDKEYDSKKNKVENLGDLKSWVSNCATHFDISWFPEEQEAVIKYLNETHYKLQK